MNTEGIKMFHVETAFAILYICKTETTHAGTVLLMSALRLGLMCGRVVVLRIFQWDYGTGA